MKTILTFFLIAAICSCNSVKKSVVKEKFTTDSTATEIKVTTQTAKIDSVGKATEKTDKTKKVTVTFTPVAKSGTDTYLLEDSVFQFALEKTPTGGKVSGTIPKGHRISAIQYEGQDKSETMKESDVKKIFNKTDIQQKEVVLNKTGETVVKNKESKRLPFTLIIGGVVLLFLIWLLFWRKK